MFFNILVGVDGRDGGRDAVALATQLVSPSERITLAHAYGDDWKPGRDGSLGRLARHRRSRQMLASERAAAGVDARLLVSGGSPVGEALHALAERRGSDLLVVGSCRRGPLGRVLLGDDTRASLNGAPCAVAIAPRGYTAKLGLARIGVGYDESPESGDALETARALAEHYGSKLSALSVISLQSIPYGEQISANLPEVARRLVDDEKQRLHGLADVDCDVTFGEPSDELARFSEQLDLLIVGSRSFGPVDRLLEGSTSNYLARRAHCPLVVVPRSASGLTEPRWRKHDGAMQAIHRGAFGP
jgi:nucleotide-binding universal stress UspA family protein